MEIVTKGFVFVIPDIILINAIKLRHQQMVDLMIFIVSVRKGLQKKKMKMMEGEEEMKKIVDKSGR